MLARLRCGAVCSSACSANADSRGLRLWLRTTGCALRLSTADGARRAVSTCRPSVRGGVALAASRRRVSRPCATLTSTRGSASVLVARCASSDAIGAEVGESRSFARGGRGGRNTAGAATAVAEEDPYAWLENDRGDAVRALVERENELATAALQETQALQEALMKEMKARLSAQTEDQLSIRMFGYEYFERTPVDKEHSIICRRRVADVAGRASSVPSDADGVEQLLDVNETASGTGFAEVELQLYSQDGCTMLYSVDTTGTDTCDLFVKDLPTGETHLVANNVDGAVFVGPDTPDGLLYLTRESGQRVVTLWHCALDDGAPGRRSKLWSLRDATCDVTLEPVGLGWWARLSCQWLKRSQVYVVDARSAAHAAASEGGDAVQASADYGGGAQGRVIASRGKWRNLSRHRPYMLHPHDPAARLDVEEHDGWLYVMSTQAPYQVWRVDPAHPASDAWELVVRESPRVQLVRAGLTQDYCVLGMKRDGVFLLEVYPWQWLLSRAAKGEPVSAGQVPELSGRPWDREGTDLWTTPSEPYAVRLFDPAADVTTLDPRTMPPELNEIRLHVRHPTARDAVFQLDLTTARATRLTREPKWKKFPWSLFEMKYDAYKMTAPASDGTTVPITVVHKSGLKLNRGNPCLMITYGSYGVDLDTSFDVTLLSLVRRGWVIAYAHVRGGGEKGQAWHDEGRAGNKLNTFTDFVTCAEYIAASGLTRPDLMAAHAGSAGGTVLGYVANQAPTLFKALVLESPYLDVAKSLSNPRNEFMEEDRLEWGDPTDATVRAVVEAYDPMRNVTAQAYPWLLLIASWQDSRVPYWHAAKFAARVLDARTNESPVLLRVRDGSHMGGSSRSFPVQQSAFLFAFLMLALDQPLK